MFLQAPDESPYDLNFMIFGFPVRIAWTFWIGAVVIGHQFASMFDAGLRDLSPGIFPLLILWTACLFVSILIHELGHAFAFRYYGTESSIVLYHFGGLAIPSSMRSRGSNGFENAFSPPRLSDLADLLIALAGPVAQLGSAMVLAGVVHAFGYRISAFASMPWPLNGLGRFFDGEPIESIALMTMVFFYVFPSVLWALLNLVPVFPLDGGRVMRSLVLLSGDRSDTWLWISMISAGGMAFYALTQGGQPIMGLLFLSLAFGNYQMMQTPYR
ncbi:site-2 protease family protein [Allorhodopirellula solitaria]|uniref:Peptidase family M50 n=1 Tax=Allorhodopirellula solitaria TaxID=2527987 RepID=A0A5C5YGD2_9BACT|nr:site-2 protease family protein [Allorhodopirellula solitaria]TWT74184.1 Peptidase family M50 [Allorhodopirellula solitaria]